MPHPKYFTHMTEGKTWLRRFFAENSNILIGIKLNKEHIFENPRAFDQEVLHRFKIYLYRPSLDRNENGTFLERYNFHYFITTFSKFFSLPSTQNWEPRKVIEPLSKTIAYLICQYRIFEKYLHLCSSIIARQLCFQSNKQV